MNFLINIQNISSQYWGTLNWCDEQVNNEMNCKELLLTEAMLLFEISYKSDVFSFITYIVENKFSQEFLEKNILF